MIGCYILFSALLNQFYIGLTQAGIEKRIEMHNSAAYGVHFTSKTNDWVLYLFIECKSVNQAVAIERHVKKMKSKKYFSDLKKYPEIAQKLLQKYSWAADSPDSYRDRWS